MQIFCTELIQLRTKIPVGEKLHIPQAFTASIFMKLTLVEQYSTGRHSVPLSSPRVNKYGIYR